MSLVDATVQRVTSCALNSTFALIVFLGLQAQASAQQQFRYDSTNFVVFAPDPNFARKVGNEAERFRKELAIEWLDMELPQWTEKCPIRVTLAAHAGGETSFAFNYMGQQRGEPNQWDMKIFGTPERLLDSVLPHEVTHTIFATYFRRPLPRWADEGACTTVEHSSEKNKNHGMLIHFLTSKPSRGIPFNRMFTMKEYPQDILPLYAQGFSVAKFLIMKKGRKHFLDFVKAGLDMESRGNELNAWDRATLQYYGYQDLSDLQVQWEGWVAAGSHETEIPPNSLRLASASGDQPNSVMKQRNVPVSSFDNFASNRAPVKQSVASLNEGWYAKQMKVGRRYRPRSKDETSNSQSRSTGSTIWR